MKIYKLIKENMITSIIIVITLITMLFVPIDKEYLTYFDFKTLGALYCIIMVIEGLKKTSFFNILSRKFIYIFKNTRSVILALIISTFVCDLFLANDMSLITILPLTCLILTSTNNEKYLAFTLILQNIAANMSGMITPHGNPQNLYLYSYYNIPTLEFIKILLPQFILVLSLLIILPLIFVKKESLTLKKENDTKINTKKIIIYLIMFLMSLLTIIRIIPLKISMIVLTILTFIIDKKVFRTMDWDLLLTFIAFFIFSGNVSRIEPIRNILTYMVDKNVLLTGILSCQFISNVPTAILLSNFTNDYKNLVISVNIGSLGTLISSLASLITLKMYLKVKNDDLAGYILKFTVISVTFLIIIGLFTLLIGGIS